jgi:NADH-quinone oxidoreductase subunit M
MPVFAAVFLVMTMSSIGLPALNGFIGEILILQGVYVVNKIWAAVAASGIVLGAAYMLWLYQRTMFGKIETPANASLRDLNGRELATFVPLIALAVWIGLYPAPFLRRIETSVGRVVARVHSVYGPAVAKGSDCATPAQAPAVPIVAGFTMAAPCGEGEQAPAPTAKVEGRR